MMAQYKAVKEKYKDCILMFRLGDFYEMFFEDALEASKILQITLTARNKGSENKTPMCGIPFHAVSGYLAKLTKAGKKVAICDQMTQPDGKGIVEREVIRVVTPGTTFDENIIEQKKNNYVSCISFLKDGFGFSYSDVTTGEFKTTEVKDLKDLENELMRLSPAECVGEENLLKNLKSIFEKLEICAFPYQCHCDFGNYFQNHFQIKSLEIFGIEGKSLALSSAVMLFEYLKETQKSDLKHIQKISYYEISEFMPLDEALIRNLELFYTSREFKKEGSLISVLDQTKCAMGGRLLRNWLLHPLLDKDAIEQRLDGVENFVKDSVLLREVREILERIHDIERLLSRLSIGTGNARDLVALKESLKQIPKLKELIGKELNSHEQLVELIERAICDEPPMTVREGGMIRTGFNSELDQLRSISTEGKTFINEMQQREIKRTGISSLKIRYNNVFGYYIEISKTNLAAVPEDYIRKQTLVNAERFITPELKEYEDKVLNAEDRIKNLEYELFYQVRMEVVKDIVKIQSSARVIAQIDVLSAFAFLAVKNNYCKPEISKSVGLKIVNGRHPVIEQLNFSNNFVPNDCEMNENKNFTLITGPNMGGKSTYLRQTALIVLMAQIGSYVPASSASIGICDRIFTRVGAADNLTKGESTFMVEMTEAAYILNNATPRSLIILDEIGRGTSTYDGVSIAWAITEFIHDNLKAKTLFATHYHELIELAERLDRAKNMSVAVKENETDGVVFLYKVVEGGVDKSYGIEVAKLAGLPVELVSRARGVLQELETKHIQKNKISPDQIPMFEDKSAREHKGIMEDLKNVDLNNLTPLQALQKLHEMKKKF